MNIKHDDWQYLFPVVIPGDTDNCHDHVAILRLRQPNAGDSTIAFGSGLAIKRLKQPVETQKGLIRVRIRPHELLVYPIPRHTNGRAALELVEITTENDDKYADVPLY